jgi:hypothetical protein
MEALGIVEGFDVIEEHSTGLGTIFRDSILQTFGFERGKKAFHRRVIVAAGFAAHARGNAVDFKSVTEVLGGVLHPAIGMMHSGAGQRLTARWKASIASGAASESSRFQPAIRLEHRSISAAK